MVVQAVSPMHWLSLPVRGKARLRRFVRDTCARPVTVVIVGCGSIASTHLSAYRSVGGVCVTSCVDTDARRAQQFCERYGVDTFHTDCISVMRDGPPDLVSVCTWPDSHAKIAAAALDAGVRGVLIEKPMCVDLAESDRIVSAAERAGALVAIGHQHRFNPVVDKARRIIQSGRIGRPIHVRLSCQTALLNNGTHGIDLLLYLLADATVDCVSAEVFVTGNAAERGLPAEDACLAHLRLSDGTEVEMITGELAPDRFSLLLVGRQGKLRLDLAKLELDSTNSGAWRPVSVKPADPHLEQAEAVVEGLRGRRSSRLCDVHKGRHVQEVITGILASAVAGRPLSLPLENRAYQYGDLLRRLRCTGSRHQRRVN
jgi:predicted dehydrogenase